MARCEGIGGEREPPSFILPAWINADNSICVDFSVPPKGGPKDFLGHWDQDGIKWDRDGNKWPKLRQSRDEDLDNFLSHFRNEDGSEGEVVITKETFFEYCADIQLSFDNERQFLFVLEQVWGVKSDDTDENFLAKVNAILRQLREKIVVALDNNIESEEAS